MEKKNIELIEIKPTKDSHRWVAITALLLAIGVILHTISPNVAGITPNWTIAMYSITIGLTNPTLPQALGIGFVAGLTLVPSSKSAFPLGNIASEIAGALTAAILVKAMFMVGMKNFKFRPFITGALATVSSGGLFTFILKVMLPLPLEVWQTKMLPAVFIIALLNGAITQMLFAPVQKLFFVQEGEKNE